MAAVHNAQFEGDSQFYGNTLAAIAIGWAPDKYQTEPAIVVGVGLLRAWLVKNMDAQTPLDRVVLLWASTRPNDLLSAEQRERIIGETIAK